MQNLSLLGRNGKLLSRPALRQSIHGNRRLGGVGGVGAHQNFKRTFVLSTKTRKHALPSSSSCLVEQQKRYMSENDLSLDRRHQEKLGHDENIEKRKIPPWRGLLEPAARAGWRTTPHSPPFDLADEQFNIIQRSDRTSKQLRRTHKMIVETHGALAEKRERERRRAVNPRKIKKDSLAYKHEVIRDNRAMAVNYGPEFTLSYMKYRMLPNFAIVRRVLMEAKSLLGPSPWQPVRLIDFGIGCGSASVAALDVFESVQWIHGVDPSQSMRDAADLLLQRMAKGKSNPPRVTLGESLSMGKSLSPSTGGFDLALCTYAGNELPFVASQLAVAATLWEKLRPGGVMIVIEPGTPDGFNTVRAIRDMLLKCCPPLQSENPGDEECHVLAPCTHNGACPMERHIPDYKKKFATGEVDEDLDEDADESDGEDDDDSDDEDDNGDEEWTDLLSEETAEGAKLDGTGLEGGMSETTAFDASFCSFVHTFPGGTRRTAGEKFSYLVVQKRVNDNTSHKSNLEGDPNPFNFASVSDLLAETYLAGKTKKEKRQKKTHREMGDKDRHKELVDKATELQNQYYTSYDDQLGLEVLHGDENRQGFGRLIRAPLKRGGHIYVDYCSAGKETGDGRIIRQRVSKGLGKKIAPGMFAAARKARWGGYWPDIKDKITEEGHSTSDFEDRTSTETSTLK